MIFDPILRAKHDYDIYIRGNYEVVKLINSNSCETKKDKINTTEKISLERIRSKDK